VPALVLDAFVERFHPWLSRWEGEGFGPVRRAWLAHARGLGGPVTVRLDREELKGRFADLGEDGALLLELPGGQVRRVNAGDVHFGAAAQGG
jgi:BirA family biotin operon repressor/biotin-[acetyl-CoA-carboxylase] ligase